MKKEIRTIREAEEFIKMALDRAVTEALARLPKDELRQILAKKYPPTFLDRVHTKGEPGQ